MRNSENENVLTAAKGRGHLIPSDLILVLLYRGGRCFDFVARIVVVDTTISMLCA